MSENGTWRINAPDVISETIDGETIILHLGNGFYFSAGGSGPDAWKLLSGSVSLRDTVAALESAYDTTGADVETEVSAFVAQLLEEELLVPVSGPGQVEALTASGKAFESPTLSKFTDMEDLLLLDPVHEVSPQQGWPYAAPANAQD